jgi:hypothetical protein
MQLAAGSSFLPDDNSFFLPSNAQTKWPWSPGTGGRDAPGAVAVASWDAWTRSWSAPMGNTQELRSAEQKFMLCSIHTYPI